MVFARDGFRLISGSLDNSIRLWDVESGREISHLTRWYKDWSRWVVCVATSPDGQHIAIGSYKKILIWNIDKRNTYHALSGATETLF